MLKGRFQLLNNARNFNDRHLLVGVISVALTIFQLRDHPFKTSANFHKFLTPTPLPSAVFQYYPSANLANFHKFQTPTPLLVVVSFLALSIAKFGKFLTPLPLRHADVLNGWSQRRSHLEMMMFQSILSFKRITLIPISHP